MPPNKNFKGSGRKKKTEIHSGGENGSVIGKGWGGGGGKNVHVACVTKYLLSRLKD